MSESIENAPLLELIAELRWATPAQSVAPHAPKIVQSTSDVEQFFMKFGGIVHQLGYSEPTRIVPPQFPMLEGQPVLRFNMNREGETKSLFQLGPGLFSANAVPPYRHWSDFAPVVKSGIEALFQARPAADAFNPIIAINLRYLDAFGPLHMQGKDPTAFIIDTLGINVSLPEALTQHLQAGKPWNSFLQFQIPIEEGVTMGLAIGQGIANDKPAMLMDTSVSATGTFEPNSEEIMGRLNRAHLLISKSFKSLMQPIAHLMPIKKGE